MTAPLTLQDYLPIQGLPGIIQHVNGFCVAALIRPQDPVARVEYETRLSPDFATQDGAEQFAQDLLDRCVRLRGTLLLLSLQLRPLPPPQGFIPCGWVDHLEVVPPVRRHP